jgi:hypothetical protein
MVTFWIWVREFFINVLANIAAGLLTPTNMIGFALTVVVGLAWLIGWHRRRLREGKRGLDSWYLIALSSAVAVVAISVAAYGIGLRSASMPTAPNSEMAAAAPIQPEKPKIAKFYSQRNKNDLADALTDLSGILNTTADDIVRKGDTFAKTWDPKAFLLALHIAFKSIKHGLVHVTAGDQLQGASTPECWPLRSAGMANGALARATAHMRHPGALKSAFADSGRNEPSPAA